ncbi:MAG: type I-G CRISPR-associated protein Csb2, partial [Polyangiaceae bacterium]
EVPYAKIGRSFVHGPHGAARVFAWDGPRFGIEDTAWVTQRYRAAFLSFLTKFHGTPSELLSGHAPDGTRTSRPHLAFVPLSHVDTQHADGSIKGLAVVIPRDANEDELRQLDATLPLVRELKFGERGVCKLEPIAFDDDIGESREKEVPFSLRFAQRYAPQIAATDWVSVTPVALGRHSKAKKGFSEEDALCRDIGDLGLPRPVEMRLQDVSFVRRSPPAREFKRGDVHAIKGRALRHVWIRFADPVAGPLVVGAGRYMGFGLLMPRPSNRGAQ